MVAKVVVVKVLPVALIKIPVVEILPVAGSILKEPTVRLLPLTFKPELALTLLLKVAASLKPAAE